MNNSSISEKDQKKLFKALDKMKAQQNDEKKKSFEKLFKKFDGEPSLSQSLNSFTVAELKEIKKIWDVNVNSTAKKGELVERIDETIQENILKGIEFFDSERVKEYEKLVNVDVESKYFNGMNSAIYFRKIGLLFPGIIDGIKKIYCPVEIKSALEESMNKKEFKNMIEKNDNILNLLRGYLHVYGVISISRFMTLVKENLQLDLEYDWFIQLILQRYSFKGNEYTICGEYICHEDVFDHMALLEEWENVEYDYKVYSTEKLIRFGRYDFGEDSEERRLMKELLLKAYTMEECDAEEIVAACEYAIRNNKELQFIMDYLGHNLVINDTDIYSRILKALVDLKEDTIHWSLKGHTPKSLNASESKQTKVKVGRNDPCPCGSGKKFKKCCGKN